MTDQPNVLIVEDDELLAAALPVQIEMLGYTVVGIPDNAESAVGAVLSRRPELVIMDINLAGTGTGLDAARAIREHYEVPIIFYTARGDVVGMRLPEWETLSCCRSQYRKRPFMRRWLELQFPSPAPAGLSG